MWTWVCREAWEAIFRGVPKHRGCYQPSYFEVGQ
jgi:hypothetical protein